MKTINLFVTVLLLILVTSCSTDNKLTSKEKETFNNFLQRMKKLKVFRSGESRGEYIYNQRMVGFYIWLKSSRQSDYIKEMKEILE